MLPVTKNELELHRNSMLQLWKNLTKIKGIEKLETIVITEVDKYGNENIVTISYKIKFIYS